MATLQNDRDIQLQGSTAFTPASAVLSADTEISNGLMKVSWAFCPDTGYDSTEVRLSDSDWGSQTVAPLFRAKASEFPYSVNTVGTYTFYIRHISNGNPSATSTTATLTVLPEDLAQQAQAQPQISSVSAIIVEGAVDGSVPSTSLPVSATVIVRQC